MEKQLYQDIIIHLEKMKKIYEILQFPKKEIKQLNQIIVSLNKLEKMEAENKDKNMAQMRTNKKQTFSDAVELLFSKKYHEISGIKMDYQKINTPEYVEAYFDLTSKSKVMKDVTALDLKLMYCLLVGQKHEVKGNKNVVYDTIKNNIRARKRGEAFKKI